MGANSLSNLIKELETVIHPILNESVKCTQTTPRKRVFDEHYLIKRLCQPKEVCRRSYEHNCTRKNYKSCRNTIKQVCNSSKVIVRNPIISDKNPDKSKNVQAKAKRSVKVQTDLLIKNNIQHKEKYTYPVRKINITSRVKPEEKCDSRDQVVEKRKQFGEYNFTSKNYNTRRRKSTSELKSIEKSREEFSQEYDSQVKKLTNYWNSLLKDGWKEQTDTDNSETESNNVESFGLLIKKFSNYQNDSAEWCLRNDHFVNSRHASETELYRNDSYAELKSNSSFDEAIYHTKPKLINNTDITNQFQILSETVIEINELKLFPIYHLNIENKNSPVSSGELIFEAAPRQFSESKRNLCIYNTRRINDNNITHSNKLCLRYIVNDNHQTSSDRKFELSTNRNSISVEVTKGVNLHKVKQALQMLHLCKEHLWKIFIFNPDFFVTNRRGVDNVYINMCCERLNIMSCLRDYGSDVQQSDFGDLAHTFWIIYRTFLLNMPIAIKKLIYHVFDKAVLHAPTIERFALITYNFLISIFICRMIISDATQK